MSEIKQSPGSGAGQRRRILPESHAFNGPGSIGFAMLLMVGGPAVADSPSCITSPGNIANCTGDQSALIEAGVDFPTSTTVLNINSSA
jgi:hypothetical protein